MIYYIDIDHTICVTEGMEYDNASPLLDRIEKINKLYDEGHEIVYWTARGTGSGIDWSRVTYVQLKKWGAKFHSLKMGKPIYDLFIDDKNINSERFFNDVSN